jgi:hypothetical protein
LSHYFGYEPHLATAMDYRARMVTTIPPGGDDWIKRPDWEWLRQTGADFVLFNEGEKLNDERLMEHVDLSDPKRVLRLPVEGKPPVVAAPLKFRPLEGDPVVLDNGYVRVRSHGGGATVQGFTANNASRIGLRIDSATGATLEYLFWPNRRLVFTIDGKKAATRRNEQGLMVLDVPAGSWDVRIDYRNGVLSLFLLVYGVYAAAVLGCAAAPLWLRFSRRLLRLRTSKT